MTWIANQHVKFKSLYLDRKMVAILSVFLILGICLVIFLIIATNTLSGLRAYSTMQGYWTESRVHGAHELRIFLKTGDTNHLDRFNEKTKYIRDARVLRNELINDSPDYDLVREKLLAIHVQPRDVNKMITTFKRFHALDHFSNAIEIWENANAVIEELEEMAIQLRTLAEVGGPDQGEAEASLARLRTINNIMEENRDSVTASLSEGTYLLQMIMIWLSISIGFVIATTGGLLTYRFMKRFKVWAEIVEVNEQRYKSLFEHNPNAVFSLTKNNLVISGNDAFTKISGYNKQDMHLKDVVKLSSASEKEIVVENLSQVLNGIPMSFETKWKQKSGSSIPVHLTVLPIYIDEKIEGIFGIAEDISFQKDAEKQIKLQLDEKNALLAEVHDRVKNNLALMSGMLQLQEEYIKDETARRYLKSTILRIHSMALVQEMLYQTESFSGVHIHEIIEALVDNIDTAHQNDSKDVNVEIHSEPMTLPIKKAIPFGLLLNELLNNSYSYAFSKDELNRLTVLLEQDENLEQNENIVRLTVKDNGPGLPDDFDIDSQTTLGMTLIRTLVQQLGAEFRYTNNNGTAIEVHFKVNRSQLVKIDKTSVVNGY